jgi:hypothetical protein
VEGGIDNGVAAALGSAHKSKRPAFPRLRLHAFEVAVHIHIKILGTAFEEGAVFSGPVEEGCTERGGSGEEGEE